MGYPIQPEEIDAAHARGAAEERAAVVAWLRQPDNDFGQAAPAIEAGEHRREGEGVTIDDRRCRDVSPQGITCGLEKGHKGEHNAIGWGVRLREGEGHSGFCQHHLTGECAPGCLRCRGSARAHAHDAKGEG